MVEDKTGAVLVVGAGVGGIRAAFDLAESGFKVYLIDRAPGIGGTITQLSEWFPDNQCEMCKLIPVFSRDECSQYCLRRDIFHPKIELLTSTRVSGLDGEAGNFKVSITTESRMVKPDRCTACGLCVDVCPVEVPDEFEGGLKNRRAIYVRNPQAVPNVFAVDSENCTRCGKCVEVCPTNAIDLQIPEETRQLDVGAVIISSGFEEFDASQMGQYGFGRYPNVLSNIQLERLLASAGATGGKLVRPSDGKEPAKVAFLQCVGSRDMKRNYCSAACCMYALKEAILIKEYNPEIVVAIFYMDMRAFGKGYYREYMKAKELGVNFIRCRISTFRENPRNRNLMVVARAENGSSISSEFELVVLSIAQCPSSGAAELSEVLGVDLNRWGFIDCQELSQVRTSKDGIYVCGSAAAPADISETVLMASAAAGEASRLLAPRRAQLLEKSDVAEAAAGDEDTRIAIFLCKCGDIIPAVVDMEKVADYVGGLPDVISVEEVDYLCLAESIDKLKDAVKNSGTNRVIIAACAPYHYHRLFGDTLREAGIDSSLWQLVNFREQIAWVHKDSPELATEKAKGALAVAAQKLRSQELLSVPSIPVAKSALVIGGGVSGLVSVLNLARQGFEVHLVERTAEPGGHVRDMYFSLGNTDPQAFLNDIIEKVKSNENIHLHLDAEVIEVSGYAGNFRSGIKTGEEVDYIDHGVVVIASGAQDYRPTEYFYGQDERIITQKELQKKLAEGKVNASTVVMIQCVGARDDEHPYCNRTCCSEAIAGALQIKEQSPETEVIILNRDIMTYAFKEEYYTQAREVGVIFLRYEAGDEPEVKVEDKAVMVTVNDPVLPGKIEIEADLLVLSTGIVAADNRHLAELLSLELTEDGFFKEVDTKFRPVDSVIAGVFICGRASAPRNLEEEVTQAAAAAQRAANMLARGTLESGRVIAEVNKRRCSGCALCVTTCPYNARRMDEDLKIAVVEEAICQGCGTCVAFCPNSAAKLRGMKEKQLFSMIEAAL